MASREPHAATAPAVVSPSPLGFQVTCDGTPIGAQHEGGGSILVFRARRHAESFAEAWNDDDLGTCQTLIDDHGTFYGWTASRSRVS